MGGERKKWESGWKEKERYLLIRSSLKKERTDNMDKKMAEVYEVDFRKPLFKLNVCIFQSKYIFRL